MSYKNHWDTAVLLPPTKSKRQQWYQQRYGDPLTLAIKRARKNLRREKYNAILEG